MRNRQEDQQQLSVYSTNKDVVWWPRWREMIPVLVQQRVSISSFFLLTKILKERVRVASGQTTMEALCVNCAGNKKINGLNNTFGQVES